MGEGEGEGTKFSPTLETNSSPTQERRLYKSQERPLWNIYAFRNFRKHVKKDLDTWGDLLVGPSAIYMYNVETRKGKY